MNYKYLLILMVSLFLIGCKSEDDSSNSGSGSGDNSDTPKTYEPLVVNLSSNNLVMIDSEQMASKEKNISSYMYAAIDFVLPSLIAADPPCLTIADVGSGVAESVINDPTRCLKKVRKVRKSGDTRGFLIWEEEDASGDTVQICGIIKPDGTVNELTMNNCPKQNAGFKNNPELVYVSDTKLRGLSSEGKYLEYDTSNDTETVIISDVSGNIDMMLEIDHTNVRKYLYKIGTDFKQSINGVVSSVPELYGKYPHKVGTDLQFKVGNVFKRAYFDALGNAITYQDSNILYQASAVPVAFAEWLITGVGVNPQGPVINASLNNCDSNKIGETTILLCDNGIYKYTNSIEDLDLLNLCSLGNCGNSESISCVTSNHYYIFTPFTDIETGEYTNLRLTKIDILNKTYENIYDNIDIDYLIESIGCSSDSVTASTTTKTIIISNADTIPIMTITDIIVEEVIPN